MNSTIKHLITIVYSIGILLGTIYIALRTWWKGWLWEQGQYTWVDFKSFKQWYRVNPQRWILSPYKISYRPPDQHEIYVNFKMINWYRYRFWYKNHKKMQHQKRLDDSLCIILKSVQNDIAVLKEQSQQRIDEEIKFLESIEETKSTLQGLEL